MTTTNFIQKLLVCLLAGLVGGAAILRIGRRFLIAWIPPGVIAVGAILFLLMALLFSIVWWYKHKRNKIDSLSVLAFWQGVIRYAIALDLSMFGWQKVFHLQFFTPLGMLDEPFNSFSGEWLTWSYFGHSYPFIITIGISQLVGSYLLLFNRTRLFGVIFILPILLNILLIDLFYGLPIGVILHASGMTISAMYLLFLEYDRLLEFFFRAKNNLPIISMKRNMKNGIRFSVVCIPLLLIAFYTFPDKYPQLTGKYEIKNILINEKNVTARTCQDSVLTIVYFDIGNDCVLECNSQKNRLFGTYEFNEAAGGLSIVWRYPTSGYDKLVATLSPIGVGKEITLTGKMGNDSLKINLIKVK